MVFRLTEQRGPDSPGGRAGSARQTCSSSRDRSSSSTSPQPPASPAAAAGPSLTPSNDDSVPVSPRSPTHPAMASVSASIARQRFSASVSADVQPQRTGSYHGDFQRRNRLADSPLRAASLDAAGRVRYVRSLKCFMLLMNNRHNYVVNC